MKETLSKKEIPIIIGAGVIIGIIAVALVYFGTLQIWALHCLLPDTSGSTDSEQCSCGSVHPPEIVGLVLGSCILCSW